MTTVPTAPATTPAAMWRPSPVRCALLTNGIGTSVAPADAESRQWDSPVGTLVGPGAVSDDAARQVHRALAPGRPTGGPGR